MLLGGSGKTQFGEGNREVGEAPLGRAVCAAVGRGLMSLCLPCTGIAMMKFKSPPVNSLSLEFLTEFSISMEKLENNRACRGVIITSVSVCSCLGHWHLGLALEGGQGALGRAMSFLLCLFLAEE